MSVLRNPAKFKGIVVVGASHAAALGDVVDDWERGDLVDPNVSVKQRPADHVKRTLEIAHAVFAFFEIHLARAFVRSRLVRDAGHPDVAVSGVHAGLSRSPASAGAFHAPAGVTLSVVRAVAAGHEVLAA